MVSRGKPFERVVLETSLKPFPNFGEAEIAATALEIAQQWAPLLEGAGSIGVLLWIGDGSEVLDWAGRDNDEVEWARWVGFNNTEAEPYGHNVTPDRWAVPYRENAPRLDYAGIRRIVTGIRSVLEEATGLDVVVGATLDSGPEFARSSFKYERHPEVLADGERSGVGRVIRMVRPWNDLAGDDRAYAAYPEGIPDGTTFGEFLGRQGYAYLQAMGFDYLWLSNGLGFSAYSWTALGELFDGERFASERAAEVRERILRFWRIFAAEIGYPVEVRGTNFGVGMDIATDAVPAREIYGSGAVRMSPPNSPWGPLNRDFGIELTGYLSRIAHTPGGGYPFRFYANDPWFWQSPWRDFYGGEPLDIHLPLAMSRVRGDGSVELPSQLEILTVDTERGELVARTAAEVSVFVRRSRDEAPDAPAPLVWLYPFDAYHDRLDGLAEGLDRPFFEDWFMSAAVNEGLPLAGVVDVAEAAGAICSGTLDASVLFAPASALDAAMLAVARRALDHGIDVVLYGSLADHPDAAHELFGLLVDAQSAGEEGDLPLEGRLASGVVRHTALLSAGPLRERLDAAREGLRVLATAGGRPYALERPVGRGMLRWLRGSSAFDGAPEDEHGLRSPRPVDRERFLSSPELFTRLAALSGWGATPVRSDHLAPAPVVSFHRHEGSLRVSGYLADTTSAVVLQTPYGAPVLTGLAARVEGDSAEYHFSTTVHAEARVFVRQDGPSTVSCVELAPFPFGTDRLLAVRGLRSADVVVSVPPWARRTAFARIGDEPVELADPGAELRFARVDGELVVGWGRRNDGCP